MIKALAFCGMIALCLAVSLTLAHRRRTRIFRAIRKRGPSRTIHFDSRKS